MKPVDDVERLVRRLKHRASPGFRTAAREKMLAELDRTVALKPRSRWRTVMSSKLARYAAAGSIAVAVLAAVVFLLGLPLGNHGIVLAQVVEKTQAFKTLVHREKRAFYREGEDKPFLVGEAVKYISAELGSAEKHYHADGGLLYAAYFLKKEKRVLVVFPALKRYLDLPLNDDLAALSDDLTPQGLVRLLTSKGSTNLGRSELDGRKVEGFEMSRESIWDVVSRFRQGFFLFPVKSAAARLWIDVETSLPVGVEAELEAGRGLFTGFREGMARFKAYDFQWGAEIDPKAFVPDIPPDYERMNPT
jgi:hypothetical protein